MPQKRILAYDRLTVKRFTKDVCFHVFDVSREMISRTPPPDVNDPYDYLDPKEELITSFEDDLHADAYDFISCIRYIVDHAEFEDYFAFEDMFTKKLNEALSNSRFPFDTIEDMYLWLRDAGLKYVMCDY